MLLSVEGCSGLNILFLVSAALATVSAVEEILIIIFLGELR